MFRNKLFYQLIIVGLLIISGYNSLYGQTDSTRFIPTIPDSSANVLFPVSQEPIKIDTIYTIDESFENTATFTARDSIYADIRKNRIYLYGDAKVHYTDIDLTADYIEIDMEKHEILPNYTYDADSNKVGVPNIKMDGQEMEVGKIRLNYETKKAFIQEVKIKQDENFLYMDVAKRQENEEIHFKKGRFTTCDLPEPHYHFQLSKAILIPEKRIVSGAMNVWIKNVPTPIGFPFAIIPQKKENDRTHGFIFPQIAPQSPMGMGLQNLGYFIPFNDTIQTTFMASGYSRGSWDLSNMTSYKIRYKFSGSTRVSFQQLRQSFPSKSRSNKLSVNWTHTQDTKANPYWNFSAKVNFVSDNNSKNNIDPLNSNYFNNTFNSDINLRRFFPGKPVTMGLKIALSQNTSTQNLMLTLPTFTTNVTRFYPFKVFRKSKIGSVKWYEQIGMTYDLEAKNMSTFKDSLLQSGNFRAIGQSFFNGINQNATLQTTIPLFGNTWKLTPSVTYRNIINFQQIRKEYDTATSNLLYDTIGKAGMANQLTTNFQLTTVVYSYYRFVGKKEPLLRHVLTPSFGYRFIPMLDNTFNYVNADNKSVAYSPYERSLYTVSATKNQSILNFSLNNTFELKKKSDKDTLTGYKKTRIIDAFTISGSYDMLKDSMKLSDITFDLRISPAKFINFVARSFFSPYSWNDSTGKTTKEWALTDRNKLGRVTYLDLNTIFTITSKENQEKINQNKELFSQYWNSDLQFYALHPEMFLDFDIPWKVNLGHIFSVNTNQAKTANNPDKYNLTHTITVNGDISITKRWKITTTAYYDIKSKTITNLKIDLVRDMHCWRMSVNWIPIGFNKSFLVTIMGTSKLFSSAKYSIRKPPELLF